MKPAAAASAPKKNSKPAAAQKKPQPQGCSARGKLRGSAAAKNKHDFQADSFIRRHIGPSQREMAEMLKTLGVSSLEELMRETLPPETQSAKSEALPPWPELSERQVLSRARRLSEKNRVFKSYIGMGYAPAMTPPALARNILENPLWHTSYTPYQAELAQGRLEALLNFQTMTADLTGMELACASLLDEGTAAAEALALLKKAQAGLTEENPRASSKTPARRFFADSRVFPQTLEVLKTRSRALGWIMETGHFEEFQTFISKKYPPKAGRLAGGEYFAVILQYPDSHGEVKDLEPFFKAMESQLVLPAAVSDLLSLAILKPPGEMGAYAVAGSAQRFGLPLFFGGPHAAYLAARKNLSRLMPGRIVGVSKDRHGRPALRLALQTREQHIRREKATSNICTSQALLATMAGFWAVYHGPDGIKKIASKINYLAKKLHTLLEDFSWERRAASGGGWSLLSRSFFDTVQLRLPSEAEAAALQKAFWKRGINLGRPQPDILSWTLSELTEEEDLLEIKEILESASLAEARKRPRGRAGAQPSGIPPHLQRQSLFLAHPVFNSFHSETELLRYIRRLQDKELSLAHSMIPLGSCTMKLNAAAELLPLSWEAFSGIHPFAPKKQAAGWLEIISELEEKLCAITGFHRFSFQPNAGSQGEYAGLLAIRRYYESRGQKRLPAAAPPDSARDICLIPVSAHGTNPASAIMAGMRVIPLLCKKDGSLDQDDLDKKLEAYGGRLACLMLTYPSTYGIFEEGVKGICAKIHKFGGKVYLDGANMNALLGLCLPQSLGFDVCHLNLHKTFCIPHGGGGPGAGPVGVTEELAPFLPGHFLFKDSPSGAVSSAPWGSAGILPISWAYIQLMGRKGLKQSAQTAIASANYIAERLSRHYRILFRGRGGRVAHECILDLRKFAVSARVSVDDVAKRLMDYGFHAPTMSWPVPGTLMAEPSESESKAEIDRFCEAMIEIRREIAEIESGRLAADKSPLKSAPHVIEDAVAETWPFACSRQKAFYPLPWVRERKFWPPVSRVENSYGDINLFCSCLPMPSPPPEGAA